MESSARKRSGPNYTIATLEELNRLIQKKKYQMVQNQNGQSDQDHPSQSVYLVPHKFPFIFTVSSQDLGSEYRYARLTDIFRKINTFRRVQLVRSSIPRKIIFTNLANHNGESMGLGKFKIALHNPLSDRLVWSSRIFDFEFLHNRKLQCAIIDLEEQSLDGDDRRITLGTNCTVLELSIAFAQYTKTQRFVLFFKPFNTIKAADLFYCLVKLNSTLTLKLYFLPEGPLASSESHQLIPHQVLFTLSKIQIETGNLHKEESLVSKGSFISAVRRAQQQASSSNYRINVVRPDPYKRYIPYDSFSARVLGKQEDAKSQVHDQEPQIQHPLSIERNPAIKEDSEARNSIQFFSNKKEPRTVFNIISEPIQTERTNNANSNFSQMQNSKGSHRTGLAWKSDWSLSSQKKKQICQETAPSPRKGAESLLPVQITSDSSANPGGFLSEESSHFGAQPAERVASESKRKDDQGLEHDPALKLGHGFVRYQYQTEAVFSRGDPFGSPMKLKKPSPNLHAPEVRPKRAANPRLSPIYPERGHEAIDPRLKSDSQAEAELATPGPVSAILLDQSRRTGNK